MLHVDLDFVSIHFFLRGGGGGGGFGGCGLKRIFSELGAFRQLEWK